jgi:rhodanese-related sulfurtransferase
VPTAVIRDELHELIHQGAQLAEVLPEDEYAAEHLPGAVHLPLKRLTAELAEHVLERGRPVVVYCWDAL